MKHVVNKVFDQERALYGESDATIDSCAFTGEADGESALKECKNLKVKDCFFDLRYPLWHAENVSVEKSNFTKSARAPIWYGRGVEIESSAFDCVKAIRECDLVKISKSRFNSDEFCQKSKNLFIDNSFINGKYAFFDSCNVKIENLDFVGKYSFQYVKNVVIKSSKLDTKDAFWHAENVELIDCEIKGEYLGWYSKNLTLTRCNII